MTIINENQNDTGVTTFTFEFIRREDVLGRAVLKDIWDSLETEEDRAYFRSIIGPLFDKNHSKF